MGSCSVNKPSTFPAVIDDLFSPRTAACLEYGLWKELNADMDVLPSVS